MRFFRRILININNPGSLGSSAVEETDDSLPRMNYSVNDAPDPNPGIPILKHVYPDPERPKGTHPKKAHNKRVR